MSAQSNANARTDAKTSNASTTQSAALRGAALAFAKPPVKPIPDSYGAKNGALAAATKAGITTNAPQSSPITSPSSSGRDEWLMLQYSGTSNTHRSIVPVTELAMQHRKSSFAKGDVSEHLLLPSVLSRRAVSPSQIAASLAASRSTPITPNHTGQQPVRPSMIHRQTSSSGRSPGRTNNRSQIVPEDALDTTSIPPTTSLIGMFERSAGSISIDKRPKSVFEITKSNTSAVVSPRPERPKSMLVEQNIGSFRKPNLPLPRRIEGDKRSRTPSRGPKLSAENLEMEDNSSEDSFVSASDQRPQSAPATKRRPVSIPASADARKIDALADAIVASSLASSLASSRAGSPSKSSLNLAPPLPPPRRGNPGLFPQQAPFDLRTPSPAKGFRQTMRKPPKDEEEDDPNMLRRGKKNIMKKHPNKHHEGDRKRWRDSVTERERKRYEAVWASNKGLHIYNDPLSFPPPPTSGTQANSVPPASTTSNCVSSLVVRDIWSRSRLGNAVLAEVWELVDRTGTGMLSRDEFVVGMWLIDQRLKGRKLPVRVGDSVWSSIASLGGVTVRGNGRKR